jgi:hypothetical protein
LENQSKKTKKQHILLNILTNWADNITNKKNVKLQFAIFSKKFSNLKANEYQMSEYVKEKMGDYKGRTD